VLGNDSDPDGNTLSAVLASGPSHGTLTLNANGSFTYTPAANYNGSDSFTYRASDGTSNLATVTLTVTATNDAPTVTVATSGTCGTNDRSGTVTLTVGDVDNPASALTLSATSSNSLLVPSGQRRLRRQRYQPHADGDLGDRSQRHRDRDRHRQRRAGHRHGPGHGEGRRQRQ
jgi:VCBS repeat-containing protein